MKNDTEERLMLAVKVCGFGCALSRAHEMAGLDTDLIATGWHYGLTTGEACGVMDGWDSSGPGRAGWESLYGNCNVTSYVLDENGQREYGRVTFTREEYDRGVELGRRLHAESR